MKPRNAALAFGLFLGGWHLLWAVLVAIGVAQPLLDLIFTLHHITPPYEVVPFNLLRAAGLVLFTFGTGYLMGWTFALVWISTTKKR